MYIRNNFYSLNGGNQMCLRAFSGILIKNGLETNSFQEYDYSPYNCFNKTIEVEPNKFRIENLEDKIPMVYSIVAKTKN